MLSAGQVPVCRKSNAHPNIDPVQEKCLAVTIYGEARGEPLRGKIAVAFTVVNRAKNTTLCSVVLAPKQYSIFNNNPALRKAATSLHLDPEQRNIIDTSNWHESLKVARLVMLKKVNDPTKGATHYLSPNLMNQMGYEYPQWAKEYKRMAVIGSHEFYKYHKPVPVAVVGSL